MKGTNPIIPPGMNFEGAKRGRSNMRMAVIVVVCYISHCSQASCLTRANKRTRKPVKGHVKPPRKRWRKSPLHNRSLHPCRNPLCQQRRHCPTFPDCHPCRPTPEQQSRRHQPRHSRAASRDYPRLHLLRPRFPRPARNTSSPAERASGPSGRNMA